MGRTLGEWESFLSKVEAHFDGIDGVFDEDELAIVWDEFIANHSVDVAVERIAENAARMVVEYFESMDGDHDSAMASCGWGTDEDYGCFGGEDF